MISIWSTLCHRRFWHSIHAVVGLAERRRKSPSNDLSNPKPKHSSGSVGHGEARWGTAGRGGARRGRRGAVRPGITFDIDPQITQDNRPGGFFGRTRNQSLSFTAFVESKTRKYHERFGAGRRTAGRRGRAGQGGAGQDAGGTVRPGGDRPSRLPDHRKQLS